MRRVKSLLVLAAALAISPVPVLAELVPADVGTGLRRVPSVVERGTSLSNAVKLSKALVDWLSARALGDKIVASLEAQEDVIRSLLTKTGQPGVLALVQIEKANNETGMLDLMGEGVQVVGAGTTPGKVAFADAEHGTLRPNPRPGSRYDEDASFYIWITQDGDGVRLRTVPVAMIKMEVAHTFTDKASRDLQDQQAPAEAMKFALAHLEATLVDSERKARLSSLRKEEEHRQKNIEAIEKRLEVELERQRRLRTASTILAAMKDIGDITVQIRSVKAALGSETPASVDGAKTQPDLNSIVGNMLSESQGAEVKLKIQRTEFRDEVKGTRIEMLNFMKQSSYPVDGVPQLGSQISLQ
jgi:hypothetical protein